uniref:E3 ubiquitin-protein ligase ZNRF1 n=1 Tax=Salmo trutta TaxID=8032 RepID=A0A674CGC8_SALTR
MGVRQSSPVAESRTRAYSSPVEPSGSSTTPGFRYTASPGGPIIRNTGGTQPNMTTRLTYLLTHSLTHSQSLWRDREKGLVGWSVCELTCPALFFPGFLCPVCSKFVASDVMEIHLIVCLTKSRLRYNEDVLVKDSGECAICLDEMEQGHTISRLPCLCIYHKGCIDEWFEVNRSCPEHPLDSGLRFPQNVYHLSTSSTSS